MIIKPEIYEAMKRRISVKPGIDKETRKRLCIRPGDVIYHFNAEGLNEGLDELDDDYIDPITHPMTTRNMWNVSQRFYSFLRHHKNIDQRLLK